MAIYIKGKKKYSSGFNSLAREKEKNSTGMEFSILVIPKGKRMKFLYPKHESVFVLLNGRGCFRSIDVAAKVGRKDIFKEKPAALSLAKNTPAEIIAQTKMELITARTRNAKVFEPRIFLPKDVRAEWRGKGVANNSAHRLVWTIFDIDNHPKSNFVLGEVINLNGRWSSCPPHHHPQPEIYYYKFLPEEGYGFCQLGEDVLKVEQNDLVKIFKGKDHPQVALPGYQMWYFWIIRHLKGIPYIKPISTKKYLKAFK